MGKYRAIPGHDGPYLCTWTVIEWQPVFVRPQYAGVILDSFRYCRERKGLALHTFVIMPTHVHLIASAVKPATIPDLMRDMKRHTSRQIHRLLLDDGRRRAIALLSGCAEPGQDFSLWRAEYHPSCSPIRRCSRRRLDMYTRIQCGPDSSTTPKRGSGRAPGAMPDERTRSWM